jgi:hypothetical protein
MNRAYGMRRALAETNARREFEIRIAGCPEPTCLAPAEVSAEAVAASTDGPVAHARTRCVRGHIFMLPVDRIPGA